MKLYSSLVLNEMAVVSNILKEVDGKWFVYSEDGKKKLSKGYASKEEAQKRLAQIEHFKQNQFSAVIANLKFDKAKIRFDNLEGRSHMVVPAVMITEGVHNGSEGPLYYPKEELERDVRAWDGRPVVVYHPQLNGRFVSASSDPVIINKHKVGQLLKTKWGEDGKLRTECWLEESRIKEVDDRVLASIQKGEMMEVSTGLFTDNEEVEGEWNGEKYRAVARNYRPDHLAILPDLKGACSIEDGAGLLRNESDGTSPEALLAKNLLEIFNELSHDDVWQKLNEKIRKKSTGGIIEAWVEKVYDSFFIFHKGDQRYYQEYTKEGDEIQLKGTPQMAEKQERYKLADGTLVGNAAMKTDGGDEYPASAYAYVPDPQKPSTWKLRLWETPEKKETAVQVGRAIAAIGKGFRGNKVEIPAADLKGVKAKIRAAWSRTNPEKKPADMPEVLRNEKGGRSMNKEQMVEAIIANAQSPWTEEDREALLVLSEEKLTWMVKNQAVPEDKDKKTPLEKTVPEGNEEEKPTENQEPITVEQFIANAPEGIQDMLRAGLAAHAVEKGKLIKKITANKRNPFPPEKLQEKDLDELKALAQLAEVPDIKPKISTPYFGGMAEAIPIGNQGEEPLTMPKMDFGKEK